MCYMINPSVLSDNISTVKRIAENFPSGHSRRIVERLSSLKAAAMAPFCPWNILQISNIPFTIEKFSNSGSNPDQTGPIVV